MINKSKILQFLIRKLIFSYAKTIFYIGEQNKKFYKMHGVKEKKLIRMPLCVNNEFFNKQKSYVNIDKEKKLLKINNEKVILISSKLIPKKSIDTLIYALENISTPYVLLVAGSGKLEKELKNLCKQLKINVRFLGFINQSQIPKYYWISDIFVMTSKKEPWGLSINEAMNCDCAIILSDRVGAKDDLVKNNGFVFKTNSVEDLQSKLEALIDNEEILNQFKRNSKKIIENFHYQSNVDSIKEFFNKNKRYA